MTAIQKAREAADRLRENLASFDAEVAYQLSIEGERADLWDEIDVNVDDLRIVLAALERVVMERDEARKEADSLKAINATLMGDDEDKPRYTTKRLRYEIEQARAADTAENATLRARLETVEAETRERAVVAGWNACRKSVYAVCEDVEAEADRIRITSTVGSASEEQHAKGYHAGTCRAAKSIARGFNSMEAMDDDNCIGAIRNLEPRHD